MFTITAVLFTGDDDGTGIAYGLSGTCNRVQ
jgi:predicted methyltransferase